MSFNITRQLKVDLKLQFDDALGILELKRYSTFMLFILIEGCHVVYVVYESS